MDLWERVGLEPWRTDGYPAACTDAAVLGYWAEAAWEIARVRDQAEAYLSALPEKVRAQLAAAARRRVLRAHLDQDV